MLVDPIYWYSYLGVPSSQRFDGTSRSADLPRCLPRTLVVDRSSFYFCCLVKWTGSQVIQFVTFWDFVVNEVTNNHPKKGTSRTAKITTTCLSFFGNGTSLESTSHESLTLYNWDWFLWNLKTPIFVRKSPGPPPGSEVWHVLLQHFFLGDVDMSRV